ncbi:hypothetical protein HUW48_08685 [Adhaeribacter radiodurans]|uniref:Uncharacterized protein n=1 Tax=Adhaeribacter radiodurans TaxID=2745197 RepID=A0A7L7L5N4_9BACT|nr:hypothetical protein HUW48_08685 [Adhaeribacter radiodurans]
MKASDNSRYRKSILKTTVFSDSIIFITNGSTIDDGNHIMIQSALFIDSCLKGGIPIKGCISQGKFTADFDNSLFFGQPLIDAYLLQEEMDVYSVVLHHSFELMMKHKKILGREFHESIRWLNYKNSFKGGASYHYHLNWVAYLVDLMKKDINDVKTEASYFYNSISGSKRKYVDNTMDFIEKAYKAVENYS